MVIDILKTPIWLCFWLVVGCLWLVWYALPGFILVRLIFINVPNFIDPSGGVVIWIAIGIAVYMYFPVPASIKKLIDKLNEFIEPSDVRDRWS